MHLNKPSRKPVVRSAQTSQWQHSLEIFISRAVNGYPCTRLTDRWEVNGK